MATKAPHFLFDRLAHYVWALSQEWPSAPGGYDVRYMVPNYEHFEQASLATVEKMLMDEVEKDATHQKLWWLQIDGALDAIGMMEADGANISQGSDSLGKDGYKNHHQNRKSEPYTSRVKSNVERVKDQYRLSPIMFEALAEDKEALSEAVMGLNEYKRKILTSNNWPQQRDAYIHDGVTFGTGVLKVHHDKNLALPDDTWFEEKAQQGVPLSMDEYMRFRKLVNTHIVEYVPTFELIRHRRARGESSRSFSHSCHPMITRCQQRSIMSLVAEYPNLDGKITAGKHSVYKDTNPEAGLIDDDQRTVTTFEVHVKLPVEYDIDIPVEMNGQVVPITKHRRRNAVMKVVMVYNHGIVDMCIDEYHHNQFPYEQWMHTPSFKHGCGIGLCKYGRDTERIFNIMLNGQLRFFGRMVKGGGFYYKGAMDPKTIEARSKEHTWIEIDPKSLPADLRNRPIGDLIQDSRPTSMPAVYDQLMNRAEDSTNRAMMVPDASRGIKQGSSGRQELVLTDQAERVMSTGIAAYENSFLSIGKKVHSNIVQFDGDTMIPLQITTPAGEKMEVVLNYPEVISEDYDPVNEEWTVLPKIIRNNLKTLHFTTQLSTQSIVPVNPAQRLHFYQDLSEKVFQILQAGPQGVALLRWMNKYAFNGVPGLDELIAETQEALEAQMQANAEAAARQEEYQRERDQREDAAKAAELAQNQQRLDQLHLQKMT